MQDWLRKQWRGERINLPLQPLREQSRASEVKKGEMQETKKIERMKERKGIN